MARVVVGGVGGSSKSTLTASLHVHLLYHGVQAGLSELDVYSGTHPILLGTARTRDRRRRSLANRERVIRPHAASFYTYFDGERTIMLGDLPGKVHSNGMHYLIGQADGAIIVDRVPLPDDHMKRRHVHHAEQWERLFARHNIPVIARVQSWRPGQELLGGEYLVFHDSGRIIQPQHPTVSRLKDIVTAFAAGLDSQAA